MLIRLCFNCGIWIYFNCDDDLANVGIEGAQAQAINS